MDAQRKRAAHQAAIARLTIAEIRRRGWHMIPCESWRIHYVRGKRILQSTDLAGMFDYLALDSGKIYGIQCTSRSNASARRKKISASPNAVPWLRAKGRILLWAWTPPANQHLSPNQILPMKSKNCGGSGRWNFAEQELVLCLQKNQKNPLQRSTTDGITTQWTPSKLPKAESLRSRKANG